MSARPTLRRLLDLPGIAALERRSVEERELTDPDARTQFPELDEASRALFGLTADEAEATPRPTGWDKIETQPLGKQVFAFEDAGWDVTDDKRRPLRVLPHFSQQLWLALRGVAGELPFQAPPDDGPDGWASTLTAEAAKFRKR